MSNERFFKQFAQNDWGMEIGAFQQWQLAIGQAPDEVMKHCKRCVTVALNEELTCAQRLYLTAYIVDGLTMDEVGKKYGVDKSTVSRTIARARRRLFRVLRYSNPRFLNLPMPTSALSQIDLGIRPSAREARRLAKDSYLKED